MEFRLSFSPLSCGFSPPGYPGKSVHILGLLGCRRLLQSLRSLLLTLFPELTRFCNKRNWVIFCSVLLFWCIEMLRFCIIPSIKEFEKSPSQGHEIVGVLVVVVVSNNSPSCLAGWPPGNWAWPMPRAGRSRSQTRRANRRRPRVRPGRIPPGARTGAGLRPGRRWRTRGRRGGSRCTRLQIDKNIICSKSRRMHNIPYF